MSAETNGGKGRQITSVEVGNEIDNGMRAVAEARRPRRMLTERQLMIRIDLLLDTIKRDCDALHKIGTISRETQLKADAIASDLSRVLMHIPKR